MRMKEMFAGDFEVLYIMFNVHIILSLEEEWLWKTRQKAIVFGKRAREN